MIKLAIIIAAALSIGSAAHAQESEFRGFRAEAKAGGDRFMANGNHDDKFTYGGAAGWDGVIDGRIVVGPEVSYLVTDGRACDATAQGGTICTKSRRELGIAVRAGFLLTPDLMFYGKGGFAQDRQRRTFTGDGAGRGAFNDRYNTDGYQFGGGVEYSLRQRFYVSGEYKYSNYYNNTSRNQLVGGVGVRF